MVIIQYSTCANCAEIHKKIRLYESDIPLLDNQEIYLGQSITVKVDQSYYNKFLSNSIRKMGRRQKKKTAKCNFRSCGFVARETILFRTRRTRSTLLEYTSGTP